MPQTKRRRAQVLIWDEVHAEFADAAKATPIEDIDRQLESMGCDLGRLRTSLARLDALPARVPAPAAYPGADAAISVAGVDTAAPAPAAAPVSALQHPRWRALAARGRSKSVVAGAMAGALAALLVLPASHSLIAQWLSSQPAKPAKTHHAGSAIDQRVQVLIQSVDVASDPLGFASNLTKAGQLLETADRSSDAAGRYFEAIALFERHSDKLKPIPLIATVAHNLARLLAAENRLDQAEQLLERALEINLMHFGPDHPDVARDIASLDALHRARTQCMKPSKTCAI